MQKKGKSNWLILFTSATISKTMIMRPLESKPEEHDVKNYEMISRKLDGMKDGHNVTFEQVTYHP